MDMAGNGISSEKKMELEDNISVNLARLECSLNNFWRGYEASHHISLTHYKIRVVF